MRRPGTILFPGWSPNGKRIVWADAPYANVPSPPGWQIWTANPDGTKPRLAVQGAALGEGLAQLDWYAPNSLAFLGHFSLFQAPLPRGKPKQLASDVGDVFSHDAAGDRFAYIASACGQGLRPSRIVVLDRRTNTRLLIGDPAAQYSEPTLSPDGSQVAFTSPDGLTVAGVDGTNVHRVASPGNCPSWSPDGSHILFVGANGSLVAIARRRTSDASGVHVALARRRHRRAREAHHAVLSSTAARTSALNARASTCSPSRMSIARRTFPSRLELKRFAGSGSEAPFAKVSFTTAL
jgi:WD40 repeat protein